MNAANLVDCSKVLEKKKWGCGILGAASQGGSRTSTLQGLLQQPRAAVLAVLFLSAFFHFGFATPQPRLKTAISLAVAAEYEEALKLFESELRQDPTNPLLNYYVGMTESRLLRFSSAIAHFETAIEHKADFPQVYFWLTKAYLEKEMKEEAMSVLEKGRKRFPLNKDLGDLVEAIEERP